MSIIAWIILGLVAGFIASKVVNKSGEGLIVDLVLGIVGAAVGGYLFTLFGAAPVTGLNLYSILVASGRGSVRPGRLSRDYGPPRPLTGSRQLTWHSDAACPRRRWHRFTPASHHSCREASRGSLGSERQPQPTSVDHRWLDRRRHPR